MGSLPDAVICVIVPLITLTVVGEARGAASGLSDGRAGLQPHHHFGVMRSRCVRPLCHGLLTPPAMGQFVGFRF